MKEMGLTIFAAVMIAIAMWLAALKTAKTLAKVQTDRIRQLDAMEANR